MSKIIEDLNGERLCPEGDLVNEYFQYSTKIKTVPNEKTKDVHKTLRKIVLKIIEKDKEDKDKEDKEGNVSKKWSETMWMCWNGEKSPFQHFFIKQVLKFC